MRILEVNYTDLPGRIFDGYDLAQELNKDSDFDVKQMVDTKISDDEFVKSVGIDSVLDAKIKFCERKYSISNMLSPKGKKIYMSEEFKQADLVHYHILHNNFVSIYDYPLLMNSKPSVWTIHDPWILTGNCIHPLDCENWKTGCKNCKMLDFYSGYEMFEDNVEFMWNQKKDVLTQVNPHIIVTSEFMRKKLCESPLTKHFNKIHMIPFGVDVEQFLQSEKITSYFGLSKGEKVIIGFRVEDAAIKGCKYIYEALAEISDSDGIQILCVGGGKLPKEIQDKFLCVELGWENDKQVMKDFFSTIDIFVMPSLAESFGVMAIEAMAAGCVVVSFKGTTVSEITESPICGVSAEYASSSDLRNKLEDLIRNKEEIKKRKIEGKQLVKEKYTWDKYKEQHKALYKLIYSENVYGVEN